MTNLARKLALIGAVLYLGAVPLVLFWNSIKGPLVVTELDRNGIIKEEVALQQYPEWGHNIRREMGLYVTRFHSKALLGVTLSGALFSVVMWFAVGANAKPSGRRQTLDKTPRPEPPTR